MTLTSKKAPLAQLPLLMFGPSFLIPCIGSIRQPASWTGIVGLKPTYGRVSRYGLLAYGSSTDVIGPLTNSVSDAAYILAAMAGKDPTHDATTSQGPPVPDYLAGLSRIEKEMQGGGGKPLAGVKVGLIKETLQSRVEVSVMVCLEEWTVRYFPYVYLYSALMVFTAVYMYRMPCLQPSKKPWINSQPWVRKSLKSLYLTWMLIVLHIMSMCFRRQVLTQLGMMV